MPLNVAHSFLPKWRRSYSHPRPSQCFAVRKALWVRTAILFFVAALFDGFCLTSFWWSEMSAMDTSMAYKTWEMSNSIETVSSVDEIFKYDRQQQQEILQAKPWQKEWVVIFKTTNIVLTVRLKLNTFSLSHPLFIFVFSSPHYFKNIRISALALLKNGRKLFVCFNNTIVVGHFVIRRKIRTQIYH